MNARERFIATIEFKEIDRPFRWENPGFWSKTIQRWQNEGLPADIPYSDLFIYFGMDKLVWLPFEGGWGGIPFCPTFERKVLEDEGEHVVIQDSLGIIMRVLKHEPETSMPQFIKFPVESKIDFEENIRWRLDYRSKERFPANWDELVREYARRDYPLGMFVSGPFGFLRNLMGDEALMYMFFDEPDFIHEIMSHYMNFYKNFMETVSRDVIPDFIMMFEDMCYKSGPLISPQTFNDFMAPYLKQVIGKAKDLGIKGIVVDNDGDVRKMLPIYLKCGANAFYPFEVQSGMDIVELRKQYGKSFAIIGGLDKRVLAESETAIVEEIEKKVPFMLSQGGFIPMFDHNIPPNVSLEMYKFALDYLRSKFGGLRS